MRTYILHLANGGVINLHGGPLTEEVVEQPKPACKTCIYWENYARDEGVCIRYPPTVYAEAGFDEDGVFAGQERPRLLAHEWCGEYERAAQ